MSSQQFARSPLARLRIVGEHIRSVKRRRCQARVTITVHLERRGIRRSHELEVRKVALESMEAAQELREGGGRGVRLWAMALTSQTAAQAREGRCASLELFLPVHRGYARAVSGLLLSISP